MADADDRPSADEGVADRGKADAADAFDEDVVRSHFAMLHKLARGLEGELVLAVYGEDPVETDPQTGKKGKPVHRNVQRFEIGDIGGMTAAAMGFSSVPHANIYAPLHVVRRGLSDSRRGQAADIVAVLGLVADMDVDNGRSGRMPVEPTLVIETSPGNSQPVIVFERPLLPMEAKPLAECLRVATRSDHGTADIAHVWRVPGTLNYPNAAKAARGRSLKPAPVKVAKSYDGTTYSLEALTEALMPWRIPPRVQKNPRENPPADFELPPRLFELIRDGVAVGQRSTEFYHAVAWLKDLGWNASTICELLSDHPGGIAEKFVGRLRSQVEVCFEKAHGKSPDAFANVWQVGDDSAEKLLRWHGDAPPQPPSWLIRNTLPETGIALIAGQFSAGKTFVAFDLAGSVLSGADFAGEGVCRRGGVLWLAAEGEAEVNARLSAVAGKLRDAVADNFDLEHLAFAWQKFDVPRLTAKDAEASLARMAEEARQRMLAQFDVPLTMIVIDTIAAAAAFDDENSASEAQKVMELLRRLTRSTGALVVAIDHYGKAVETGVRGSSAKAASADAILAILAEKDQEGSIKGRRLTVYKLRSGPTGRVVRFELRPTPISFGEGTTCVVDWRLEAGEARTPTAPQSEWRGRTKFLKRAMEAVSRDGHGDLLRPFGADGAEVHAVDRLRVRNEFFASISVDHSSGPDAKRKAFQRAIDDATSRDLIQCREIDYRDWLWFTTASGPIKADISRTDRTASKTLCPVRPRTDQDKGDKCPPCPPCPGAEPRDERLRAFSNGAACG